MPKFFVKENQIFDKTIKITGSDVNHIKNVLRKKIGNEIVICNSDKEENYLCEITKIKEDTIECNIKDEINKSIESNVEVTILQGLPKADKMEMIIQKSVELGVHDIIPVEMKRCVVKLNEKDKIKKLTRWQKISEVASKQCGRNIIPEIGKIINIKDICNSIEKYDIVLVAYELEKEITIKQVLKSLKEKYIRNTKIKIAILVGPEGGIAKEEVELLKENNAQRITLGKRILRTETVALNILSIIMYELEN